VNQIQALPKLGLSLNTYAWSTIVIDGLVTLLSFVLGGILFWRRSDDWMVHLVALLFVSSGATTATNALNFSPSLWGVLQNSVLLIESLAIFLTLALFPNGRFVPRWSQWIVLVYPAYVVFYLVFLNQLHLPGWLLFNNPVNAALWFGGWGIFTLAQLYRYFRISTPIERLQTRWVAFAFFVILVVGIVGLVTTPTLLSLLHNGFLYMFLTDLGPVVGLCLPLSIGIAILRYRLYEIDRIINRTLVYAALTLSLALIYFGLVIGLESLVHLVNNQAGQSPIIIVASTLAIAALFNPLRHRFQVFIDRRFYRNKYDAARTLEAFSATLQNEVDLALLSEHLLAVVRETMQPTSLALWVFSMKQRASEEEEALLRGGDQFSAERSHS
jgi:hypothetical protein